MSDVQNRKQTNKNRGKQESGRRDTEDIRKTQMELLKIKNIMYEVKNTLDGINKKLDTSGEKANELEDTATETNLEDRGKKDKKQNRAQECLLRDSCKWPNTQFTVPEGKKWRTETKKINEKAPPNSKFGENHKPTDKQSQQKKHEGENQETKTVSSTS